MLHVGDGSFKGSLLQPFSSCYNIHTFKNKILFQQTYPQFFEASKPQFTYFVTPSGDRCVRFLAALAECGLFILAERIEGNAS